MVRSPWVDGNGIKRGAWSNEEDEILQDYIRKHGVQNWRGLPKLAGLKRCGKSCRLRWMNYLKPDLKHGRYTKSEEDLVIRMHEQHGNKWAMIASKLPGRSDNDIKNYWHTHLEKRVVGPKKLARDNNKTRKSSIEGHISDTSQKNAIMQCGDQIQILESCPLSLSEKLAPSSSTTSGCDISTGSNFSSLDDGGLEEIMQFVELSPLMSPFEDDSRELMATYEGEFVAQETPITTVDEIYGEVVLEEDDIWSQAFMGNNEVLFSPCLNYDYESFFDGIDLELLEQTMQEMMP